MAGRVAPGLSVARACAYAYLGLLAGVNRAGADPGRPDFPPRPPLLGWSSWTSLRLKIDQPTIEAEAAVLAAKLRAHGFRYINLDDGWFRGWDDHGRLQADRTKFPDGMAALGTHLHQLGLKFGVYLTPGLAKGAWSANGLVAGTAIHVRDIADPSQAGNTKGDAYRIDYAKPGATAYVQSYADLLASWGVDYLKLDFVGPGGGRVKADNREDVKAWSAALQRTGRPIWLELSNKLSLAHAPIWKTYANGWRIEGDVEAYGKDGKLTLWSKVAQRFADAPPWAGHAASGAWNDLDSLEIGNGDRDGLTLDERRTVITLWSIECSPLILGSDLRHLDDQDLALLLNQEVLDVDQRGRVATPVGPPGQQQVWRADNADGSSTLALFNLDLAPATMTVSASDLGQPGAFSLRDLWSHEDLGRFTAGYTVVLRAHACQLLRVTGR